jgi:malonate transporter and related proteins
VGQGFSIRGNRLAPIFSVMALGFVAEIPRATDSHHVDGINVLVMNFALPPSR